jgi:uncharacterized cupin superfamily protein
MTDANLAGSPVELEHGGVRLRAVGKLAGAELLGATAYELEPGAKWAELHAHYANEELIVVLEGTPTLHTLDGSRELAPGDVVACLRGRRGAHRVENASAAPARILIVSTMTMPELVEYPERPNGGRVFVMTEPPWTDEPYDPARGRIIRSFDIASGAPVPPDE